MANRLLAAESDTTLIIRVVGKGTWVESEALKSFCEKKLGEGFKEIIVGLKKCKYLDSTFVGVLCGISLQMQRKGWGKIALVNVNGDIAKIFQTLGLQDVVSMWSEASLGSMKTEEIPAEVSSSKSKKMKHILEAHRILTKASSQSENKFKDLLAQMEKEWKKYGE